VKLTSNALSFSILILPLLLAPLSNAWGQEPLTNAAIIELHRMGFGEEVLVEKIRGTPCQFDVSLEGLRTLKEAEVPQSVIAEMIAVDSGRSNGAGALEAAPEGDPNDPLAFHSAGIYLFQEDAEGPRLIKIEPSVYTQAKSGGFLKHAFSYGIAKIKSKAILPGASARLQIRDRQPTFYFYFEETESGLSYQNQATTSPAEFILAEFDVNEKKNHRQLVVGQANAFGAQSGALDKTVRLFDFEELDSGIFRVIPQRPLDPGEYTFYYAGATPLPFYGFVGPSGGGKVFDFGIR